MPGRWLGAFFAAAGALFPPFAQAEVPVVELDGVVHAVTAAHVVQAIDRADAMQAPLLVIRVDTPGGLDSSMRQIVDKMLNCRTPVAVFVGPSGARAASAGFVIAVSADVAAMAPGTNIGAAHPVSGLGQMDEVMSKKVTSDAAAYIRGKAERRGRNVEMAEKAVVEVGQGDELFSLVVHPLTGRVEIQVGEYKHPEEFVVEDAEGEEQFE